MRIAAKIAASGGYQVKNRRRKSEKKRISGQAGKYDVVPIDNKYIISVREISTCPCGAGIRIIAVSQDYRVGPHRKKRPTPGAKELYGMERLQPNDAAGTR